MRSDPRDPVLADQRRPVNSDEAVVGKVTLGGADRAAVDDGLPARTQLDIIARCLDPVDLAGQQRDIAPGLFLSTYRGAKQEDCGP